MRQHLFRIVVAFAFSASFAVPAWASTAISGSGTLTDSDGTLTSLRQFGGNTFLTAAYTETETGILTGTCAATISELIRPDGYRVFTGRNTCSGSVASRPGTYIVDFVGTQPVGQPWQGQLFVSGTGSLDGVHGQGTFQGRGCCGTYAAQVEFEH
jgi:hypothetical protein